MRRTFTLVALLAALARAQEPTLEPLPLPPESTIPMEPAASTATMESENLGLELDDRLEMESDEDAAAREKREKRDLELRGLESRLRDARREGRLREAGRLEKKIQRRGGETPKD